MKKAALWIFGLLALVLAGIYFGPEHQRFLEFDRQRDAWHRRCDVYRGTDGIQCRALDAGCLACVEELQAMTAYAKRQGWDR